MHTSTVTVAVLEYYKQEINLDDNDLVVEWFSGTGAGGQHRNKTQNSCRLIHKPTGIVASAQTRSRTNSLENARQVLLERMTTAQSETVHNSLSQTRKTQVGSGQRGDKIRTIQFQNDNAVDHRTGKRCTAQDYIKGHMYKLWN